MNDALIEAVQRSIAENLNELNTMVPGVIVSYDAGTNRAVVQPSLSKMMPDGSNLPPPQIVSVPVKWPAGGGGYMTFPLNAGDPVELRFSQRSLDNWLSGISEASSDPRSFDLTDCVADPGLAPVGIPGNQNGAVWQYKNARIFIGNDGTIELSNGAGKLTLQSDGKVKATVDVLANTVSLKDHVHINVQPGTGISGKPQL